MIPYGYRVPVRPALSYSPARSSPRWVRTASPGGSLGFSWHKPGEGRTSFAGSRRFLERMLLIFGMTRRRTGARERSKCCTIRCTTSMAPGKRAQRPGAKDGLEWTPNGNAGPPHPSPRESYGLVIPLVGGGSLQTARRERHQPIFGPGGELVVNV